MTGVLDLLSDGSHGGATLTVWPGGEEHTLDQVWARAARASRWFSERFAPGEPVAMVLEGSVESLVALVGAWRSGQTVVSLPLRPAGTTGAAHSEQIRSLVATTGARAVIASGPTADRLQRAGGPATIRFDVVQDGKGPVRDEQGDFVQCSSGTTGRPKAIALGSEAMAANAAAIVDRYDNGVPLVSLSWLPLSHDMGLVGMCLAPWAYCGLSGPRPGRLHLMRPEAFMRSPRSWMRACSDVRATVTAGPTFALDAVAATAPGPDLDLSSLEVVCVGAEPVWATVLHRFEAATAPLGLRDTAVSPAYGMAEATLGVSASGAGERWSSVSVDDPAGGEAREVVGLGRPLDGVEVRVDDDGQLAVRSPALMDGYIGRDPVVGAAGWYRTGDLGGLAGDQVVVHGRVDDLIFVAGENVHATEVEHAIAEKVGEGLVAGAIVPDGTRLALVATIAPGHGDLGARARDLRHAATTALGAPPSRVVIVPRREVPFTGTGKLQRGVLAHRLASDGFTVLHEDAPTRGARGARRRAEPEATTTPRQAAQEGCA